MKKTEQQLITENNIRSAILSKFPLLGVTLNSAKFIPDEKVSTVETNGVDIFYNPKYIDSISYEQQIFDFAHNAMHIQFNHVARSKDKDPSTWSYATDAVINQILKSQGMMISDGYIDVPNALNQSAEELYTGLMTQQQNMASQSTPTQSQKKQKRKKTRKSKRQGNSNNQDMPGMNLPSPLGGQGQSQQNNSNSQQNQHTKPADQSHGIENKPQQQPAPQNEEKPIPQSENNQNDMTKKQEKVDEQSDMNNGQHQQNSHQMSSDSYHNQPQDGLFDSQEDEFHQGYDEEDVSQPQPTPEMIEMYEQYMEYRNSGQIEQQHEVWEDNASKLSKKQAVMKFFKPNSNIPDETTSEQYFGEENQQQKNGSAEQVIGYISEKNGKGKKSQKNTEKEDAKNLKRLEKSPTLQQFEAKLDETYKPIVDWKQYLKRNKELREEEKIEYHWSRRRSDAETHWQSRLDRYKRLREEELDEEKPITLITIDTSPSISDDLLNGFINQLKELTDESNIYISCFYDHAREFQKVEEDKNGNLYIMIQRGWGTDLDDACRAFKRFEEKNPDKKILNRIIFTDGDPHNGTQPMPDLYDTDCLWLIFDYPGVFRPCCGRVLQFSSRDLMKDIRHEQKEKKVIASDDEPLILK